MKLDEFNQILARLRTNDATLNSVDFSGTHLAAEDVEAIANALQCNTNFTVLSLYGCELEDDSAEFIATIVARGVIQHLSLRFNNFTDEGIIIIAEAVKTNTSLISLDLQGNYFKAEGAKAVAAMLYWNINLQHLSLAYSRIQNVGAKYIAKALRNNKTLTCLYLDNTQINDAGATVIASLINNGVLTKLSIGYNKISDAGIMPIADAVANSKTLKYLSLDGTEIANESATVIAKILKNNCSLENLNLLYTKITDDGAVALADALKVNHTLRGFKIGAGGLFWTSTIAFNTVMRQNMSLQQILCPSSYVKPNRFRYELLCQWTYFCAIGLGLVNARPYQDYLKPACVPPPEERERMQNNGTPWKAPVLLFNAKSAKDLQQITLPADVTHKIAEILGVAHVRKYVGY